jgi:THO complex subunit 4
LKLIGVLFKELFEDVGAVRVARVHYDENGRSLGTGEVVFERRADAVSAQQKYNTLNLDGEWFNSDKKYLIHYFAQFSGRPMDIRLVGGVDNGAQQQQQTNRVPYANGGGGGGNQRSGFRNNNQQNGTRGGGNRSRGGKQQQNGNTKKENVSAVDLDAELDAYRAESAPKKWWHLNNIRCFSSLLQKKTKLNYVL